MNHILSEHSNDLTTKLEISARNTLDRLTNEDQYHEVTKSHLHNIQKRADEKLEQLEQTFIKQSKVQQNTFSAELKKMQTQVDSKTQELSNTQNKLKVVEREITNLKWICGGLFTIGAVVTFIMIK